MSKESGCFLKRVHLGGAAHTQTTSVVELFERAVKRTIDVCGYHTVMDSIDMRDPRGQFTARSSLQSTLFCDEAGFSDPRATTARGSPVNENSFFLPRDA